jgi:hypothetical protein
MIGRETTERERESERERERGKERERDKKIIISSNLSFLLQSRSSVAGKSISFLNLS